MSPTKKIIILGVAVVVAGAFLWFSVSSYFQNSVRAQTRMVGVNLGNKFTYSVTVRWSSNDPNATPPSYLLELNDTQWLGLTITGIYGTNITGQTTTHYKNGTETTTGGWVDVNTGDSANLTGLVISANLTAGDSVYTSSPFNTWMINETVPRTYLSGVRITHHYSVLSSVGTTSGRDDRYWDKSTGVTVEILDEATTQAGVYTTKLSEDVQIINSYLWRV